MADIIPKAATDYIKNKNLKVGFSYKDVWHEEHATGFTVAKAMQFDVLSDMHSAVTKAVESGQSFETFKKNLKPTLQQKGWWGRKEMEDPLTGKTVDAQLGSDRRLKTIYNTNMSNAFLIAKYRRIMDDPLITHIMYISSTSSLHPRPIHQQWNGLILPKDDPWWGLHLPRKEWGCKCDFQGVSEYRKQKYEKEGIPTPKRLDGSGGGVIPVKTEAPPEVYRTYYNERKGTTEKVPQGVHPAFNWDQRKVSRQEAAKWKMEQSRQNYEENAAKAKDFILQPLLPKNEEPEIVKKFFDEAGVVETDLRGLEPETKEEVLASFKRTFEKLPGTKGAVPAIKVDYAMDIKEYADTSELNGTITLNGALFKNIANLKKLYDNDIDPKVLEHPIGTSYRSIVVHEASHSIILMISVKHSLRVKELCDKIQKDVLDCYNITQDQITDELSRYAKESSFDFVAEGLAEFVDSKTSRRVARKIGEIVLAYLKELR